jgi:nucleotide-binding universal stress UspA family protein
MPPLIKKALVAINDSEAALHAFLEAIQLSRRIGFRLCAVSVAPPYTGDLSLTGVRSFKRAFTEPIATVLEEAVKIATSEKVGLETFRAEGEPAESIIALAQSQDCDLLIIGQAKRSCWNAWDSETARLIRHCPTDLLVIPQNRPLLLKRILYVDSEAAGPGAAHQAERLAGLLGAQLHILRCAWMPADPEQPVTASDSGAMPAMPVTVEKIHQKRQVWEAIASHTQKQGAAMMVLPAAKNTRIWDRLTGRGQLRLLRRTFLPTWFLRAQPQALPPRPA